MLGGRDGDMTASRSVMRVSSNILRYARLAASMKKPRLILLVCAIHLVGLCSSNSGGTHRLRGGGEEGGRRGRREMTALSEEAKW